jgi:hypothetical protein
MIDSRKSPTSPDPPDPRPGWLVDSLLWCSSPYDLHVERVAPTRRAGRNREVCRGRRAGLIVCDMGGIEIRLEGVETKWSVEAIVKTHFLLWCRQTEIHCSAPWQSRSVIP